MDAANVTKLKQEQGMFELSLMNAEASFAKFDDVIIEAIDRGIPPELIMRLKHLWEKTKEVAGEVIAVGKIIVRQIIEFLKKNPKLAIGLALGVAVATLIGSIPFIGPLLQPLATWIGTIYGAGVGAAMQKGGTSGTPMSAATALAEKFFELFVSVLNSVAEYFSAS